MTAMLTLLCLLAPAIVGGLLWACLILGGEADEIAGRK